MKGLALRFQRSPDGVLSRTAYRRMQVVLWVYSICWLLALIAVYTWWRPSLIVRIALGVPLVLGTPAITDLVRGYEAYVRDYHRQANGDWGTDDSA